MGKLTLEKTKLLKFQFKAGKAQEISDGFKSLKNPGFFAFLWSGLNNWPANPLAKIILSLIENLQHYTNQFQPLHSA